MFELTGKQYALHDAPPPPPTRSQRQRIRRALNAGAIQDCIADALARVGVTVDSSGQLELGAGDAEQALQAAMPAIAAEVESGHGLPEDSDDDDSSSADDEGEDGAPRAAAAAPAAAGAGAGAAQELPRRAIGGIAGPNSIGPEPEFAGQHAPPSMRDIWEDDDGPFKCDCTDRFHADHCVRDVGQRLEGWDEKTWDEATAAIEDDDIDCAHERFLLYKAAYWKIYDNHKYQERKPLPLCVVGFIRRCWPSADGEYVGFKASKPRERAPQGNEGR